MDILNTVIAKDHPVRHLTILVPIILLLFFHATALPAQVRILSIQSSRFPPYEESARGFQTICKTQMERLVISEMKGMDIVAEIRKARPSLILAIGVDALKEIKGIDDIPVVYLMVSNPQSVSGKGANVTGVRMNVPQEEQVSIFLKAVPSLKTVGLIYNQAMTGYQARRAMDACRDAGVNMIARDISEAREAPSAIMELKGKVDGFWMLPDATVFTPETREFLFLFSMENRVPILTFAEKYVESGAMISIGMDPFDMGVQAGEMALGILSGKPVSAVQPVDARKRVITINQKIAGKLGVAVDEKTIPGANFQR
jgi:putative tryptophan/tyrosine transport system substrate-binding protein